MKLADGASVEVGERVGGWWLDSGNGDIVAVSGVVIASRKLKVPIYNDRGWETGHQSVSLKEIYSTRRAALEAALAQEPPTP